MGGFYRVCRGTPRVWAGKKAHFPVFLQTKNMLLQENPFFHSLRWVVKNHEWQFVWGWNVAPLCAKEEGEEEIIIRIEIARMTGVMGTAREIGAKTDPVTETGTVETMTVTGAITEAAASASDS